jgi:hypothetical protein
MRTRSLIAAALLLALAPLADAARARDVVMLRGTVFQLHGPGRLIEHSRADDLDLFEVNVSRSRDHATVRFYEGNYPRFNRERRPFVKTTVANKEAAVCSWGDGVTFGREVLLRFRPPEDIADDRLGWYVHVVYSGLTAAERARADALIESIEPLR